MTNKLLFIRALKNKNQNIVLKNCRGILQDESIVPQTLRTREDKNQQMELLYLTKSIK